MKRSCDPQHRSLPRQRDMPVYRSGLVLMLLALASCGTSDEAQSGTEGSETPLGSDERTHNIDDFPRVSELAPGVYSYEVLRSHELGGTTNSLFVVTSEGVLVADGQGSHEATQDMVEAIAHITDQPITYVVIGSDHGDHVAGNAAFPADVTFVAHPTSAAVLAESNDPVPPAGTLVEDRLTLEMGSHRIEILHLGRAHTGGDLVVYLPEERILFLGEIFFNQLFPSMRSAYPSEWITVIDRAQAMDVDLYIPGHGFVEPTNVLAEQLDAYKDAMLTVIAETTRLHAAGFSIEEALSHADFGEYETWMGRDRQVERAIPRIYAELNGQLP